MDTLIKIGYGLLVIVAISLGALLLVVQTSIIPGFEAKIVQSGSMEPAILTGSLVIVQASDSYAINDVVTFQSRSSDIPTTHRLIGDELQEGELRYETKGDANEDPDATFLRPEQIIGKVILSVPYLGYLLDFARQPLGFFLLIGIPVLLIAWEEVGVIVKEMRKKRPEEAETNHE